MPLPVVKHAVVGQLFDRMAMQQYALRYVDLVAATLKAQPAPQTPEYGPVEVVSDLVRNLLALDQSTPIYAAFHVDYQGKRACRTRPVWVSLERVVDGKWVDSGSKDVPYSIIVWAKPQADEKAQPAPTEAQCEHQVADIRNPIVKSGYMCIECGKLFAAADHGEKPTEAAQETKK